MSECTLEFVRRDLRQAWKEHTAGELSALGTTILAIERLVNYLQGIESTVRPETDVGRTSIERV